MAAPVNLPWMPHYRGDYLRVTYGWPPIARLCYLELLGVQWDRGELPLEAEALYMLCPGVSADQWGVAWSHIASQFPVDGNVRKNYQLEMTRGESLRVAASRSRAGKAAASARWNGRAPKEPPSSNQE